MIKKRFVWICFPVLVFVMTLSSTVVYSVEKHVFTDVCPPFFLRDDTGTIINPVVGENTDKPYSPRQTCGLTGCHNYKKITGGYHFQQGKDEKPNEKLASLYQWVLSPGQYGGRW